MGAGGGTGTRTTQACPDPCPPRAIGQLLQPRSSPQFLITGRQEGHGAGRVTGTMEAGVRAPWGGAQEPPEAGGCPLCCWRPPWRWRRLFQEPQEVHTQLIWVPAHPHPQLQPRPLPLRPSDRESCWGQQLGTRWPLQVITCSEGRLALRAPPRREASSAWAPFPAGRVCCVSGWLVSREHRDLIDPTPGDTWAQWEGQVLAPPLGGALSE